MKFTTTVAAATMVAATFVFVAPAAAVPLASVPANVADWAAKPYSPEAPASIAAPGNTATLEFDGTGSGLPASGDVPTGFTMVQPSSAVNPTAPTVLLDQEYFLPANLSVSGGALNITATKGIAFEKWATTTPDNTDWKNRQDNTLGVGLNPGTSIIRLQSTVTNPAGIYNAAQAGVWFGPDDENFFKVVLSGTASATSDTGRQFQLKREVAGVTTSTAVNEINIAQAGTIAVGQAVTVYLDINPVTLKAVGSFQIGAGAITTIGTMDVPASFINGSLMAASPNPVIPGVKTFGGVFATKRNMPAATPVTFAIQRFAVAELDTTPPAAPAGITADATSDQTALAWTAPADADVVGYRVYRSATANPVPATAANLVSGASLVTTTAFTDSDVFVGQTFNYTAYAVDGSGNVSVAGASVGAATPVPTGTLVEKFDFTLPAGTSAAGYTKDAGAAFTDAEGFGWLTVDDSTPTSFALNTRVRVAANGVTDPRLLSLIHMQYGMSGDQANPPNPANGITSEQGFWEFAVADGRYNVVVAAGDTSAGNFDSTHTVVVEGTTAVNGFPGTAAKPFEQGIVQVDVTDGKLTIAPTGGDNTKLAFVEIYQVELLAPAAPADLTAVLAADSESVALSWAASAGAAGYNVFRSETTTVPTNGQPLNAAPLTSTSFTDETIEAGKTYSYAVVAKGGAAPDSAASAAATVVVPGIPVAPATPTGVSATAGEDTITVAWTPVAGATGYKVYRGNSATVSTGGAALSGVDPITAATFVDETAVAGITYHYVVVAHGTGGLVSSASASDSATIEEVVPPGACEATEWTATYFSGTELQGAALATECRTGLLGWLEPGQSPAAGVPASDFSGRFSTTVDGGEGTYAFKVFADDGVRVFVDGTKILDQWGVNSGWTERNVAVALAAGPHTVVVEYSQGGGYGRLDLSYTVTPLAECAATSWSATYFAGTELAGTPLATQCRPGLLGWLSPGQSPYAGVPAENFSGRFVKTIDDGAGTYAFKVFADDGVRVFIDDVKVLDQWGVNSGWTERAFSVSLDDSEHTVVVEYSQGNGYGRLDLDYTHTPPADCADTSWSTSYFAGTELAGEPIVTECRTGLLGWLSPGQSPAAGVPAENFSGRFTTTVDDGAGTYAFKVFADDGVRVFVDDVKVLDQWGVNSGWTERAFSVALGAGDHTVVVEYSQGNGYGRLDLGYTVTPTAGCAASSWSASYFAGTELAGTPVATQCRTNLLGWIEPGQTPLAGVPAQDFSGRFVKTIDEGAGTYTFSAFADDGIRVFVDGTKVLDQWGVNSGWTERTFSVPLGAGPHTVTVEYYQGGGWGRLDLSYTKSGVDVEAPQAPTALTAAVAGAGIAVSWTASASTDAVGYNVYRRTSPGVTVANGLKRNTAPLTAPTFQDNTAALDVTYYYVVTAVDAAGNESVVSNEASAVRASVPDTEAPVAPTALTAVAGNGQAQLSWVASTSTDTVGYRVYRALEPGSIPTRQLVSGAAPLTTPAFTDTTVSNGTTYFYVVTAVDLAGNASVVSNEAYAVPRVPNTTDIKVDFTATDAVPVAGYVADWGQSYGARTSTGQGSGLTYGWVDTDGNLLSLVTNGRDRNRAGVPALVDSMIHMQYGDVDNGAGANGVKIDGTWELAVPDGLYDVTVAVGDQMGATTYDSQHVINIEGSVGIEKFQATAAEEYKTVTTRVGVWDGRLTIDAKAGFNTKLGYVTVTGVPWTSHVETVLPANRVADHDVNAGVSATIKLPYAGVGVKATSLPGNVHLYRVADGVEVPTTVGTSGGNDVISLAPNAPLAPSTQYRFVVTSGVQDNFNNPFVPFTSVFTTGLGIVDPGGNGQYSPLTNIAFEKVELTIGAGKYWSSFTFGPDGKLYGTTIGQGLWRFTVAADGTLTNMENLGYMGIAMVGVLFDKTATAGNLKLWVTTTTANFSESGEWVSGISLLSGPNLATRSQVFSELPRSLSDHLTNSMSYGPDGRIYFLQGSNQAAGDLDSSWGQRGEQLLTAAVLVFDPDNAQVTAAKNGGGAISVKTAQGGTYNPYAAAAPLKLYATGIRNAYDLVWHSNGHLYVPTNGTAGGANSPGVNYNAATDTYTRVAAAGIPGFSTVNGQDVTAQCRARDARDASYIPTSVPAVGNHPTQRDHLYDVVEGGYYGHPNPTRCEWVLHEGNDPAKPPQWAGQGGTKYPSGVKADPNYRGVSYDFEFNKSPNGALEYKSSTFGGQLKGRLVVTRFSNNNDLIFIQPDAATGEILGAQTEVGITGVPNTTMQGVGGFNDPLEVVENPANGNLYVNQYDRSGSSQKLYLLRVPASQQASQIAVSQNELIFSAVKSNGTSTAAQKTDVTNITVTNNATSAVPLAAAVSGANAAEFTVVGSVPTTLASGASATVQVRFTPGTTVGQRSAVITFTSGTSAIAVGLYGLSMNGIEGGNEPTFANVLGTLGYNVNPGWTTLEGGMSPAAKGDEVLEPLFVKSGTGAVSWTPLSHYAPLENIPFGWYTGDGAAADRHEVGAISSAGYQSLLPPKTAASTASFDPGVAQFGFYYYSATFARYGFTEDRLNSPAGSQHRARIYPAKNRAGVLIPNSYIVAFEDASNGDYQDYVFLVSGVKPVTDTGSVDGGVRVDFTTGAGDLAAGYLRDFGQAYGVRTGTDQGSGLTYGWKDQTTENDINISVGGTTPGNGRDRGSAQADVRLDSFMHMQSSSLTNFNGTPATVFWEIAVPNGTYTVTVGVGDATVGNDAESHVINAENAPLLTAFTPSGAAGSNTRHKISTATVVVSDGALTLDAIGGVNTKIGFVDVVPAEDTTGDDPSDGAQVKINFQTVDAPTPAGWTADTGLAYAAGRGFGWINAANSQPVDRSIATRYRTGPLNGIVYPTDARLQSYAFLDNATQPTYTNGIWEYAVPNGDYQVAVSVGDANYVDSTHGVTVEGQPVIASFLPTTATPFQTGVRNITVTDGKVSIANSGTNTKINWVSIKGDALNGPVAPITRVSFRPTGLTLPAGWVEDNGQAYGAGKPYGWLVGGVATDRSSQTRNRTAATAGITYPTNDVTRQSFILTQATTTTGTVITGGTVGTWEYPLANGTYTVSASVGDAGFLDSVHGIAAEGTPLVTNYTPTGTAPFASGTATVVVTDGKLSVTPTGVNTKLNWVTIQGQGLSAPSIGVTANGTNVSSSFSGGAATVAVTGTAASGATISSLTYKVGAGAVTPYTAPFVLETPGTYAVEFTAVDSQSRTTTRTVTFEVLNIGGTAKITNAQVTRQADGTPLPGLSDTTFVMHRVNSLGSDPVHATLLYNDTVNATIQNTGTKDLRITSLALGGAQAAQFEIVGAPTLPLLVQPGQSIPLVVKFIATSGSKGVRTATLTIASSDTAAATKVIQLRGGYMSGPEGNNELNLAQIVDLYGWGTNVGPITGGMSLGNGSEIPGAPMNGDEIRSYQWKRLDTSKPVQARQLAAFHGCCTATETININGQSQTHATPYGQAIYPLKSNGTNVEISTSPGGNFGITIAGQSTTQTAYQAIKMWPVKDAAGKPIPGAWFAGHDYISSPAQCGTGPTNCDFQDNVYLITNVLPVASSDTTAPTVPAPPTGVANATGVDLSWATSTDADLIGYRVERSAAATGPWTTISGTALLTATTFRDTTAGPAATTYYRVSAVDVSGNASPSMAAAINTSAIAMAPIRINAGSTAATTIGGVVWGADQYFTGGKAYANNNIVDVLGTTSDALYRSERSATTGPGTFSYAIPVPTSGSYVVKLHFAEIYHGATGGGPAGTGKRVFSVNLEGGPVEINNLDLNAVVAPMTAYITTNTLTVTDGTLNIAFTSTVDQPKVSAIEITKAP